MEEIRTIRGKAVANKAADSAIITKADLDRIRNSCKIQSKEEAQAERALLNTQKGESRAGANARKENMKRHDGVRASRLPPTQ